MKGKKIKLLLTIYFILLGVAFAVISVDYGKKGYSIKYNTEQAVVMDKGWELKYGNAMVPIEVPCKINAKAGEWFTIVNRIPDVEMEGRTLCLRGSMNSIVVKCDDEVLYSYLTMQGEKPGNLAGSIWHTVRIPMKYTGSKIEISIKSDTSSFAGKINPIYMGTKTAILYKLAQEYGMGFIMALTLLVLGVILLVIYYMTKSKLDYLNLFYLTWTVIFISLWLLSETKLVQFFIGNYFIVTKVTFVALAIIPIPLTMFLENSYKRHHKSAAPFFLVAFLINAAMGLALHVTGKMDFFLSMRATTSLIMAMIIYYMLSMIYEIIRYRNKEALKTFLPFLVPFMFGVFEFLQLFKENYMELGDAIQLGIMLYLLILIIMAMRNIDEFSTKYHETKYFKELAYTDILTGAKNRAAYTDEIKSFCYDLDSIPVAGVNFGNSFWLVLFDLNGLKEINDRLGHSFGDKAIILAHEAINTVYGDDGNVYRIGGDEFASILFNVTASEMEKRNNKLQELCKRISEREGVEISISQGYGNYQRGKWVSYEAFYHFVDRQMYSNKRDMKEQRDKSPK